MNWQQAWPRAEKLLEGASRRLVRGATSEIEISCLDWGGEGDLVLLHHANGFCAATFAPIADALRSRFRVVAVDARGHGHSTPVPVGGDPDPYSWSAMAEDLRSAVHQILDFTGSDRVELGIGHSFGGALSLVSAEREPELFARLLLCDPVVFDSTWVQSQSQSASRGPDLAEGARKRRDRFGSREEAYEHFLGRGVFVDFTPEALALYVGEAIAATNEGDFTLRCRPEVEAAVFSTADRTNLFEDAPQVTAEVRFVHALRGNFPRQRYDDLAALIPAATVESLDVGHLFPMEEPERVIGIIDAWLA